jgi:hypothetical protein
MPRDKEGWGWPVLAKKWHYFVDGRSLCNSWIYVGDLTTGVAYTSNECKRCTRLLEARNASR